MNIEKPSTDSSDVKERVQVNNESLSFEDVLSKTKKLQEQKDFNLERRLRGEISGVELDALNSQIDVEIEEIENQFSTLYKVEIQADQEEIKPEENTELLSNAEKFRIEKEKPPFEKAVQNSTNIEELIEECLPKIGVVSDEQGTFTSEELKDILYKAYTGKTLLTEVPLTYGLRTKVAELIEALKNETPHVQTKEGLESPKIQFPEDLQTVKALQKKLQEYKERLGEEMKNDPYKAPEFFTDSIYKIAVLEKLLLQGEVDTHALSREVHEKFGGLNTSDFDNACGVIEDYVKTGGKEVSRGTGLPLEEEPEIQTHDAVSVLNEEPEDTSEKKPLSVFENGLLTQDSSPNEVPEESAVETASEVGNESTDTAVPEEESFGSEKNKEQEVSSSRDFRDLIINVIGRHNDWKYSNGEPFDTKSLIETINHIRVGSKTPDHITSRYGLRAKVMDLLEK